MAVRLFVGNLAYDVTEGELREFLSAAGPPLSVRILIDRETGKPRGFAFVEFGDAAQAAEAIRRFHQQEFKGRPLVVNEARPREEGAPPRGSVGVPGLRAEPPDRPARPDPPPRTFGPDAARRGQRKPKSRSPKGERPPKAPRRERRGGQFTAAGVDEFEDQGADEVAFWAREPVDTPDGE